MTPFSTVRLSPTDYVDFDDMEAPREQLDRAEATSNAAETSDDLRVVLRNRLGGLRGCERKDGDVGLLPHCEEHHEHHYSYQTLTFPQQEHDQLDRVGDRAYIVDEEPAAKEHADPHPDASGLVESALASVAFVLADDVLSYEAGSHPS